MIVFPNCKINIGLHITAKREDGYHSIETIFFPIPFYDLLEVVPNMNGKGCQLEQTGIRIEGDPDHNLCVKAYHLLKKDFAALPAITTYLHKQIPAGAGLGGGSADGAFMLQLLTDLFSLPLTSEQLQRYALQLGSDCPFFIMNKPVVATGRGEKMLPLALSLKGWYLALLLPGVHVSTRSAFEGCMPRPAAIALEQLIQQPVAAWRDTLHNQFEETVFVYYPQLASCKEFLYENGATYASMTGTGSTIYGLFTSAPDIAVLRNGCGCDVRVFQL